jgi:ABC-type oligopeptide transport system substrate-binding subunit
MLVFNLKQIGIDVQVKYFDIHSLADKVATRGEAFDLTLLVWVTDYPDGGGFSVPLLSRGRRLRVANGVNLDDAHIQRRIDDANRLTGEARRKAWADLDVDLMRDNPPWAPFVHTLTRTFVSKSTGCVVVHPFYSFDIAAACKE